MKIFTNYNQYYSRPLFKNNQRTIDEIKQEEDKISNEEANIKKQIDALTKEQSKLDNEERKLEREMNEIKRLER